MDIRADGIMTEQPDNNGQIGIQSGRKADRRQNKETYGQTNTHIDRRIHTHTHTHTHRRIDTKMDTHIYGQMNRRTCGTAKRKTVS